MSMAPAQSPGGLFTKPAGGKRVSPRALILIISAIALSFVVLFAVIFGRGKHADASAAKQPAGIAQNVGAKPPSDLTSPEKSAGFIQKAQQMFTSNSASDPQVSPEILKERAEFDKEIRRDAHQRHMAKIALADSAMAADIVGEKGNSEPAQPGSSYAQGAADQGEAATIQRLPSGELALGTSGAVAQLSDTDPNMQMRKEAFGGRSEASLSYLPFKKEAPLSPYEVKQGSVIPGIMITGINSDLPGQIIAQVSQNVYDSVTGNHLLIPQGTKVVGSYDSFIAIGQERAMVAWRRLIFPDGKSLELLNMPGADQGGYSGFNDQVNNHYFKIFGSALILSFLGAGYQLSQPDSRGEYPTNREIVAAETARNLSQVGSEIMRKNINIQPTIEIRPGYRFNIIVNKDMILEPYVAQ